MCHECGQKAYIDSPNTTCDKLGNTVHRVCPEPPEISLIRELQGRILELEGLLWPKNK